MISRDEIFFFGALGAVLFFQLSGFKVEKLLTIFLIIIFAYFVFYYLDTKSKQSVEANQVVENNINLEAEARKEATTEVYNVATFPKQKKFKYLFKNKIMTEIVDDVDILRMFDRARYGDLILHMDNMQKVYIYILANRYEPKSYIGTFIDLSDKVLEILYSMVFVVPESLRHVYGLNTQEMMEANTKRFTALRTKMLRILENYAKKEKGLQYTPEYFPRPSNNYNSMILF